jgi:antirestriction protein
MSTFNIYVADLAAYNNGILHGEWIDASLEPSEIREKISFMLARSPLEGAEEYAIHDYEGFGQYAISEYEGIDEVSQVAKFIAEFPNFGAELLNTFSDIDEARTAADEAYAGCYASLEDYAQELTEQTSEVPKHLEFYIDYDKMGRDMEMSGEIFTIEVSHSEMHIFYNH